LFFLGNTARETPAVVFIIIIYKKRNRQQRRPVQAAPGRGRGCGFPQRGVVLSWRVYEPEGRPPQGNPFSSFEKKAFLGRRSHHFSMSKLAMLPG
jgi:hypothetical protein